jgi:hypothetical protein
MSYVLYNAAHANTSIRSHDGKAWIRILGFFDSRDEAFKHAAKINEGMKQEIRLAPIHNFRMLLRDGFTPKNLIDLREKETQKHAFLLETHVKVRSHAIKQTQENADLRKMAGTTSFHHYKEKQGEGEEGEEEEEEKGDKKDFQKQLEVEERNKIKSDLPSISRNDEIRMQRFAAISIIPDYEVLGIKARRMALKKAQAQKEYTKKKNELISEKVKQGFSIPSSSKLTASFLQKYPPPPHYDELGNRTTRSVLDNNEPQEPDSEISTWMKMRNDAIEDALFKEMNIEKPTVIEDFVEEGEKGEEEEPAVMFLGVSDREDEMETMIQKIVDTDMSIKHYDIACVAMYEWLSISSLSLNNNGLRKKYRDPQLNKLHDARLAHSEEAATLVKEGSANVIDILV